MIRKSSEIRNGSEGFGKVRKGFGTLPNGAEAFGNWALRGCYSAPPSAEPEALGSGSGMMSASFAGAVNVTF